MDTTIITVLVIGVIVVILLMLLFSAIRVVQQYERGIHALRPGTSGAGATEA